MSILCPILARDSIHPVHHGGHCVCVGPCLVPPLPTVSNRWSLPINLISGVATLTCVKIASDPCSRLHRPCVSRGHCLCVCVCVFDTACSPHRPLRPPAVLAHQFNLCAGHAYMCQDCVRSLPEAPSTLCMTRDTVCVCLPCLLPPPTESSRCSLPISLITWGGLAFKCQV